MDCLKIGWCEADITPDKKVPLAGQFAERISEYVEKPITATAMAVECAGEQMVLVSADVVSISYRTVDAIRERLAGNEVGLDPMKVVVSAIHTHTAPLLPTDTRQTQYTNIQATFRGLIESFLPEGRKYVESVNTQSPDIITVDEFHELFISQVTRAILEAWKSRKAGSYSTGFGRAAVGLCRRTVFSDGSAQMWGDTNTAAFVELEGGNDSGIELMYVFDDKRALTGIVINLACPAQCVQHRLFVSPDFWGEVKMLLRKRFGEHLFVLPQCSAAGDQCPVDLIRFVEPESDIHDPNLIRHDPPRRKADPSMFDLAGMRKTGRRIANEVIAVFEDGLDEPEQAPVFEHKVNMLQLPLRRATMTDYENARRAIKRYLDEHPGDVDYNNAAELQVHMGVVRRFHVQDVMEVVECEVHVIRLGNIAFASNPFELFLNYGNQIKARSKAEQTFLIQLANGKEGYLPTEKAERGGHYSGFIASGQVGHEGGDLLVRQTLDCINKMF